MLNNNFSIILARKLLKISTISEETGISRTTLTDLYYRRTERISLNVLDRLCSYLDCTPNDIFTKEIDP